MKINTEKVKDALAWAGVVSMIACGVAMVGFIMYHAARIAIISWSNPEYRRAGFLLIGSVAMLAAISAAAKWCIDRVTTKGNNQ